jgi:hypothetical protein
VLWVRLDPAAELLCDIRLMQVLAAASNALGGSRRSFTSELYC